jgi:hypothetical protein
MKEMTYQLPAKIVIRKRAGVGKGTLFTSQHHKTIIEIDPHSGVKTSTAL